MTTETTVAGLDGGRVTVLDRGGMLRIDLSTGVIGCGALLTPADIVRLIRCLRGDRPPYRHEQLCALWIGDVVVLKTGMAPGSIGEVSVALTQTAARALADAIDPPGVEDAIKRRTDDNLRRVFGF